MSGIAADAALALGVLCCWIAAAGFLRLGNAYDRLHCVGFATLAGGFFITLALLVQQSFTDYGIKAIAIYLLLAVMNAVLTHATGRALKLRQDAGEAP